MDIISRSRAARRVGDSIPRGCQRASERATSDQGEQSTAARERGPGHRGDQIAHLRAGRGRGRAARKRRCPRDGVGVGVAAGATGRRPWWEAASAMGGWLGEIWSGAESRGGRGARRVTLPTVTVSASAHWSGVGAGRGRRREGKGGGAWGGLSPSLWVGGVVSFPHKWA